MIWAPGANKGVTPVDRPVVPNAEETSKNASQAPIFVVDPALTAASTDGTKIIVPIEIIISDVTVATSALLVTSDGIRLLNTKTLSLPLADAAIAKQTIATVVVLKPPAVEAGDEPIHIMNDQRIFVVVWNSYIGIVAKPALRVEKVENMIP